REQAALFPDRAALSQDCQSRTSSATNTPIYVEYGHDCRGFWEQALDVGVALFTTAGVMPYDRNAGHFGHNAVGRFSLKLPSHFLWPSVKVFSPWATRHIAWLPLR